LGYAEEPKAMKTIGILDPTKVGRVKMCLVCKKVYVKDPGSVGYCRKCGKTGMIRSFYLIPVEEIREASNPGKLDSL
jgi:ribosomal protein L40E